MDKSNEARAPSGAAAGRTAELNALAERLRDCLEELDRLQLWAAGAHVSQALGALEVEISSRP
jgi:hypothetical protein